MKARLKVSCALAAILTGWAGAAFAADPAATPDAADAAAAPASGVEEIVVTAERRSENVETVPSTVQAFTGKMLDALDVKSLDGLLRYTPNVTFANNGPGQGNIFLRGLSAGFAGNQSSATIGNFPNVAIYLDDQSMQFPARNVDIYVVDMDHIEVLEGPQGTLFGGGAEAGAVRYITNKPKLNLFEGDAEASYGFTAHGDPNAAANVTVNIPVVKDKLAVRAVIYDDRRGGYIDNVPSTLTRSNADLGNYYLNIKPTAGKCPNGGAAPASGYCTLPNAPQGNNAAVVGNAQNPVTYTGARLEALYQIDDDWNVLISESLQNLDAEGISAQYPIGSDFQTLAPLEITAFTPSYDKDKFENTSWTVNGKISNFKIIYTGSYMVRHISQQMDYANYARSYFGPYYQCTGGNTGFGKGPAQCYSPDGYWQDTVRNTHLSQEVRIASPDTWRLRVQAGAFYEQFKIYDVQSFNYKTFPACDPANLAAALAGGAPCVADVATAPGSTANAPGIQSDQTAFGEDVQRGYDQTAVFVSGDFDLIPGKLTLSGGTRYFRYSDYEVGSVYATTTGCLDVPNGECTSGETNINAHNDHAVYTGFKSRANVTWHFDQDSIAYFTFSQGFRPGGFNRLQQKVIDNAAGAPQFLEPNSYAPDSLTNYEVGYKTELFDHRLLINLSAYLMDWDNVQFLIYNPTEGINTTFGINGPSYNVKGIEAQFVGRVTEGLTVQGSGSYNRDTQSTSPCLVDNIAGTPSYGSCITTVKPSGEAAQAFANPFGTMGSVPAFSPSFQGNIRVRYEWEAHDYRFNATAGGNYVGSMYNEPATYPAGADVLVPNTSLLRFYQPAYATADASLGVGKDRWTAQLFATNLFNSNASQFTSTAQFIKAEVPLRPRVVGLKLGASF